jgi:flagellar protein FlaG
MEISQITQVGKDIASEITTTAKSTAGSSDAVAESSPRKAQQVAPQHDAHTPAAITEETVASLQAFSRELNFSIDQNSQRTVVSVVDKKSGDLIRQIPSEEFLKIAEKLKSMQSNVKQPIGVLVNKEV